MTASRYFALALAASCAQSLTAQDHSHASNTVGLGHVTFPIACRPAAQRAFLRGLALQHSFWYEEAGKAFTSAAQADSTCAMAYWGLAMSYFHPLWWQREGELGLAEGQAAAQRAAALGGRTRRERAYIAAVGAYYRDYTAVGAPVRIQAYADSMAQAARRNPRDPEAAIFYALALIATAPPGDTTLAHQRHADSILDSLFTRYPDHPGLAHYLIHANDSPQLAAQGLSAARRYARVAPAVPHAIHMPSHIFLRLGLWDEAIASNERATAAGRRYQVEEHMPGTWFHNLHTMDFMEIGFLQEGRDREARRIVEEVDTTSVVVPQEPQIAALFHVIIPLRYALERGAWAEAAALSVPAVPAGTPVAAAHFARALGAARMGDTVEARAELLNLAALEDSLRARRDTVRAEYVETLREAAAAWATRASGDTAAALRLAASAADRQDMSGEAPYLFARELEGELLLASGRPAEAAYAFTLAFTLVPHRARSLFGAAQAAEQLGDTATARARYGEYVALMARGDGTRPELAIAQRSLATR